MVISVEVNQVSHSAIARALAINTFLGWMRPGRNCTPACEAFENIRIGLDAVIAQWQLKKGIFISFYKIKVCFINVFLGIKHAYPASFPRQPSWENDNGWVESFNVVQILAGLLKDEDRNLFRSLRGYGIHRSQLTLRLPVGKRSYRIVKKF